jgi:hypothetical protein
MGDPLRSVIYVPSGLELDRWLAVCAEAVDAHGWDLSAVVRCWEDVTQLIRGGLLDLVVTGSREHLPPDRLPRVVAVDELETPAIPPGQRRPQRLPRPAG